MFWDKKSLAKRHKEIELNVIHLENLIERAISNANKAVLAFDKGLKDLHSKSDEIPDDFKAIVSVEKIMSARRFIEQNENILTEIKPILANRLLQTPRVVSESYKATQSKNHEAVIMFLTYGMNKKDKELNEEPLWSLLQSVLLSKDSKAHLINVVISLKDFQELFRKNFSISLNNYIHENRLDELRELKNGDFDLSKLILLCEELNSAHQNQNYLSVAMLTRAILDHVSPIFGFTTFAEVSSNYGGRSLKRSLQSLQNSSRNIADAYLHQSIRKKESLPNETQVDFRSDLDVLLGEIVRVLK